jgi:hypothetical protein
MFFDMKPSELNQLFERHVLKPPMCYNVQGISSKCFAILNSILKYPTGCFNL